MAMSKFEWVTRFQRAFSVATQNFSHDWSEFALSCFEALSAYFPDNPERAAIEEVAAWVFYYD